ncbi:MAG: pallilysin-related adhesin [Treponemataceae bacterium]|nr:pallilysin-related adhesin [Treponemataceae bacterium]
MKKLTIVIFLIVAGVLAFFYFNQDLNQKEEDTTESPLYSKIVTPTDTGTWDEDNSSSTEQQEESAFISHIQLLPGETFLQTYEAVLANHSKQDQMDDQISAIKKTGHNNIFLLIGIYDAATNTYVRSAEIETKITKFSTFSLSFIDLIGNHVNSIIYTGFSDDNKTIFQAYQPSEENGVFSITQIASLSTEGTYSIQEPQRSDAYLHGTATGESYQIWEYSPDPGSNTLDQIQSVYSWNPLLNTYEKISSRKITGNQINSQELARILDGTTATFSKFLSGIWYKTTKDADGQRYIFFNPDEQEVICFTDETQEVYSWNSDWMRRYGLSMTAKNKSTTAITRQIDTTLVATNEIIVVVTDEVRMDITENSLWNGNYKKQVQKQEEYIEESINTSIAEYLVASETPWTIQDEYNVTFSDSTWVSKNGSKTISGIFITSYAFGTEIIQFRSLYEDAILNGCFITKADTSSRQDRDILILQAADITTAGLVTTGEQIFLERKKQ